MSRLPVLVSLGGINAMGRMLGHGGYLHHVNGQLKAKDSLWALEDLQMLTGKQEVESHEKMAAYTGVREIETNHFDYRQTPTLKKLSTEQQNACKSVGIEQELYFKTSEEHPVSFAGQLPSGFCPELLYNSRSHPRGLVMTVFGASEAVMGMGISWPELRKTLSPQQILVMAGSAMTQMGPSGTTNHAAARSRGEKLNPRALAMGLGQTPADFVNSYVIGSLGATGHNMGACATFGYQLSVAVQQIKSGKVDFAVVGATEAPVLPDYIDGFLASNGAATTQRLLDLQTRLGLPASPIRYDLACRPFGDNLGVVVGEGSSFAVVMSDELAMATGANILGIIADPSINADGYKASLPQPGAGNYLSIGYSLSNVEKLDPKGIKNSFMVAHGTGTPLNKSTESDCLSKVATGFGIKDWLITGAKGKLGHTMASAGGDGLAYALGTLKYGVLPGILTTDVLAQDVYSEGLDFALENKQLDHDALRWGFINSKGFGGNNATFAVSSPEVAKEILSQKYNTKEQNKWQKINEKVSSQSEKYLNESHQGNFDIQYHFKKNVIEGETEINIKNKTLTIEDPNQVNNFQIDW